MYLRLLTLVLFVATSVATSFAGGDDPPPVFDKRQFAEAKKAAENENKWLIAKATAVWCAPCKQMDRTTWRDEKVVEWLSKNAIAVAFDVDKEKKLAQELSIEAMPTMIAFRKGKEFDRVVGYKAPAEFLVWLEGIARGEKSLQAVRKRAGTRDAAKGSVDISARMELAGSLARSGKLDEATSEYTWLWQHCLEHRPSFYGVRLSFMASDMKRLAARYAGAKQKFTELRDRTAQAIKAEKVDPNDLVDWVTLNRIVGDSNATLVWFDKVKDQPRWRPLINRIARDLQELLIAKRRWADIGRIYTDSIRALEQEHEINAMSPKRDLPKGLSDEQRKRIEDAPQRRLREKAGIIYAGLLAADREDDATKFASRARELDESVAMIAALASTALKADQPREKHLGWISKIGGEDSSLAKLRDQIRAALDEK
jgi:thioredoxin-related protein